jgi:predicted HicB family RNase H-like nuclease
VDAQEQLAHVYLDAVPRDLWRRVKAAAALDGVTVQQWVIDNLRKMVEKGDK